MDQLALSWSSRGKILFRFAFIFFTLYIIIQNNGAFPFWDKLMYYPTEGLHVFIPWVADTFLNLPEPITVFTNGSGDTTYDYVIDLTIFVVAFIGMIIWTLLDKNRTNYEQLYAWLMVAIRFYVGLMLIQYGMVKVFKLQFSSPGPYHLLQSYGDSSPMGLAWTFFGFSKEYNYFIGAAELAAILLLFRRTTAFGALITLTTSLNIMAVNYFFDVPVKLLSTSLAIMSIVILLHDRKRILSFFFTNKMVSLPAFPSPQIKRKPLRIGLISLKYLVIGYACIWGAIETYDQLDEWGDGAPKDQFYGVFDTKHMIVNGDTVSLVKGDPELWDKLIVQWQGYAHVKLMNGERKRFLYESDSISTITLTERTPDSLKTNFTYEFKGDELSFAGIMEDDTLMIHMERVNLDSMELTRRGFHWISEYPYNR